MRVEITEERLKDAGYSLAKGDTFTVPDELGQKWCDHGWARDTSGAYPSNERVPGPAALNVKSAKTGGK